MKKLFLLLFILGSVSPAQYNENRFSIGINGLYTTSASIYLDPYSTDPVLRNEAFIIEDILSQSVDFRYRFSDEIIFGLNAGYMSAKDRGPNLTAGSKIIIVNDGFRMIPVELSIFYLLPFSTENLKFLMGGGGGFYWGEHIREFGDAKVSTIDRENAFGIHVSVAMDYLIEEFLYFRGELKFRDPQINVTNKYANKTVNYGGGEITLADDTFTSRINVDGVTFLLGLVFQF